MCSKQVLLCSVNHQAISAVNEWRGRKINAHPVGMSLKSESRPFHILRRTCRGGFCSVWQRVWPHCKCERDLNTEVTVNSPSAFLFASLMTGGYSWPSLRGLAPELSPHQAQVTWFHGRSFLGSRCSPRGSGKWLSLLPPAAPKQRFPFLSSIEKLPKPLHTVQLTQKQARENDVNLNFCLIK